MAECRISYQWHYKKIDEKSGAVSLQPALPVIHPNALIAQTSLRKYAPNIDTDGLVLCRVTVEEVGSPNPSFQ